MLHLAAAATAAKDLSPTQFTAMMRLDQDRAIAQVALCIRVPAQMCEGAGPSPGADVARVGTGPGRRQGWRARSAAS